MICLAFIIWSSGIPHFGGLFELKNKAITYCSVTTFLTGPCGGWSPLRLLYCNQMCMSKNGIAYKF